MREGEKHREPEGGGGRKSENQRGEREKLVNINRWMKWIIYRERVRESEKNREPEGEREY